MASYPISPHPPDEFTAKNFGRCISTGSDFPPHCNCPQQIASCFSCNIAWLIVLMPFLFWWSTWFGRHLSDTQISEYLNDNKHPRHIQHALVQLGERMERSDATAATWYPELVRLASHPVEEVRNTDAWLMGLDTSYEGFHATLLKMLQRLLNHCPRKRGVVSRTLWRRVKAEHRLSPYCNPPESSRQVPGRVVDVDRRSGPPSIKAA